MRLVRSAAGGEQVVDRRRAARRRGSRGAVAGTTWGRRNWATPRRSQPSNASAGSAARRRVALEHRHLVTVPGQQQRGRQPPDAASDDHDPRHAWPPSRPWRPLNGDRAAGSWRTGDVLLENGADVVSPVPVRLKVTSPSCVRSSVADPRGGSARGYVTCGVPRPGHVHAARGCALAVVGALVDRGLRRRRRRRRVRGHCGDDRPDAGADAAATTGGVSTTTDGGRATRPSLRRRATPPPRPADTSEPATRTGVPQPEGEPDLDASFVYGYPITVSRLDPHRASISQDATTLFPVYDRLVDVAPNGDLVPDLAESWEFSDDGLTLTLHIRPDVLFHDGATLDAEAVKTNLERAKSIEGSSVATDLASIAVGDGRRPDDGRAHAVARRTWRSSARSPTAPGSSSARRRSPTGSTSTPTWSGPGRSRWCPTSTATRRSTSASTTTGTRTTSPRSRTSRSGSSPTTSPA